MSYSLNHSATRARTNPAKYFRSLEGCWRNQRKDLGFGFLSLAALHATQADLFRPSR